MAEWHDVARLAFGDFSHEWHISGCFILGLAAVLAPLLVLFGLKYGLVTSMLTALAEDPEKRELRPLGSGHYTALWFRDMRARPEVAFVSPRTHTLAAASRSPPPSAPTATSSAGSATATPPGPPGVGAEIKAGKHDFKSLEKYMLANGDITPNKSGRQEAFKDLVNRFVL